MHYALVKTDVTYKKCIIKYFCAIENLFDMFIDSEQICLICEAIDLVQGQTFTIDCTSGFDSTRIYGAFASGIDIYLNKHTDKDFTYCCTTIHTKVGYTMNQNVGYFTFPRLVIAIPIRPGHVLFFNPQESHCVSSRCDNADHIYCLSLYFKSDNISKNDNKLALNLSEETLLAEFKKGNIAN